MSDWQPIATAPKGKQCLLYYPATGTLRGSIGPKLFEMVRIGVVGDTPNREPSHWAPIPPLPGKESA